MEDVLLFSVQCDWTCAAALAHRSDFGVNDRPIEPTEIPGRGAFVNR